MEHQRASLGSVWDFSGLDGRFPPVLFRNVPPKTLDFSKPPRLRPKLFFFSPMVSPKPKFLVFLCLFPVFKTLAWSTPC